MSLLPALTDSLQVTFASTSTTRSLLQAEFPYLAPYFH